MNVRVYRVPVKREAKIEVLHNFQNWKKRFAHIENEFS